MKATTTVVRTTRPDEQDVTAFTIVHYGDIVYAIEEIKRAVKMWSGTPEGQLAYDQSSEDYNWGDLCQDLDCQNLAVGHASPIYFNPKIIKSISWDNIHDEFRVEHDELLME